MGCGISKASKQKMELQSQKIEELIEVNGQLAQQIAELKDLRNKRKPIYVVYDQEIDDLYVFKTDLDKKFAKMEQDMLVIKQELQINTKPVVPKKKSHRPNELEEFKNEDQWLKATCITILDDAG